MACLGTETSSPSLYYVTICQGFGSTRWSIIITAEFFKLKEAFEVKEGKRETELQNLDPDLDKFL